MKFRFTLMVLAFLVIILKPVGTVNSYDNETEISCFVYSSDCEVVTIDLQNSNLQYAEKVNAYDGFVGSTVGEARPPDLEISKVYYTTIHRSNWQRTNLETIIRRPRDGLMQLV
jgi:hypothetical protein